MSSSSSGRFQILKLWNRKKKSHNKDKCLLFALFVFVFIYLQKPDVSFICIKLSPGGRLGLFLLLLFYFPSQESWPGYWTCLYSKNLKYFLGAVIFPRHSQIAVLLSSIIKIYLSESLKWKSEVKEKSSYHFHDMKINFIVYFDK